MIDIPETVTKIDQDCFDSCQKLKKYKCGMKHLPFLDCSKINFLILNDEVVKISDHDFDELINLQYLIVPDEIIAESKKIFINCKKLMEVNKPELNALINNSYKGVDITEITSKMFKGWINLHYLEIPESVTKIQSGAFDDCINLKILNCDPKWFNLVPIKRVTKLIIPKFVKKLDSGIFDEFENLTKIVIPEGIKIKSI